MFPVLLYVLVISVILGIAAKLILLGQAILAGRARKLLKRNGQLLRLINSDIRSAIMLIVVQVLVGAAPITTILLNKVPSHPTLANYLGLIWLLLISLILTVKAWLNQADTVWMLEQEDEHKEESSG